MAGSVLDHMPDRDVTGYELDLSRSELLPLRRRYHRGSSTRPTSLQPSRAALVVGSPSANPDPLIESLRVGGWVVSTCAGPGQVPCPVMRGQECSLRATADVAVVYLDPDAMWPASATLPRVRCAADSGSPGVIALEGRRTEPSFSDNHATVGADRDPQVIVDVMDVLCLERDRTSL